MSMTKKTIAHKKLPRVVISDFEKQYFQRWKTLGPLLDSIRHDELRRMTDAEYLKIVERVWSVNVQRSPRHDSGLVEWQRMLRR